jgi:hypothetical protein
VKESFNTPEKQPAPIATLSPKPFGITLSVSKTLEPINPLFFFAVIIEKTGTSNFGSS